MSRLTVFKSMEMKLLTITRMFAQYIHTSRLLRLIIWNSRRTSSENGWGGGDGIEMGGGGDEMGQIEIASLIGEEVSSQPPPPPQSLLNPFHNHRLYAITITASSQDGVSNKGKKYSHTSRLLRLIIGNSRHTSGENGWGGGNGIEMGGGGDEMGQIEIASVIGEEVSSLPPPQSLLNPFHNHRLCAITTSSQDGVSNKISNSSKPKPDSHILALKTILISNNVPSPTHQSPNPTPIFLP
ncbi:hypothetical protein L2E82_01175 [Cichorium intybus]|uniref:Uncharacterized protein n=1 Tax=Cichorium intybus TaxID=13427 RepID=A0ACB9GZ90_CICIN|nr:hypothetical protein L2E82_01175 [Cichorium intybus]